MNVQFKQLISGIIIMTIILSVLIICFVCLVMNVDPTTTGNYINIIYNNSVIGAILGACLSYLFVQLKT